MNWGRAEFRPFPNFFKHKNMKSIKYRCKTIIAFGLNVNGKMTRISFNASTSGESYYITSEPSIAKAIEETDFFKRGIVFTSTPLKDVIAEMKKEEKSNKKKGLSEEGKQEIESENEKKDYGLEFKSLLEAREFLVNEGLLRADVIVTKEDIVALLESRGCKLKKK